MLCIDPEHYNALPCCVMKYHVNNAREEEHSLTKTN